MIEGFGLKVYVAGVCGISMSAIAQILNAEGHVVYGSDEKTAGETIETLNNRGIKTFTNLTEEGIARVKPDTFIFSVAIKEENPEFKYAKSINMQILSRGEALGLIASSFKKTIAISGSHGKTTATSLTAHVLSNSMEDVSCHIGGIAKNFNSNFHLGSLKNIFVTEACEYYDSFLNLDSDIAVVLNVSDDHLDYFKTTQNIKNAFCKFMNKVKEGGTLILNLDDDFLSSIYEEICGKYRVITYSLKNERANVFVSYNRKLSNGKQVFDCSYFKKTISEIYLPMVGEHNLYNALVALIIAKEFGIEDYEIKRALACFDGVERRYEYITKLNGADIIHDYAHHPEEIDAVISETLSITNGNLFVVFQPHTYSRTKKLWQEFANVLKRPYRTILLPIYPARENPIKDISSENLCFHVNKNGGACYYIPNYELLYNLLCNLVQEGDKVLILGAGDIVDFTKYLLTH